MNPLSLKLHFSGVLSQQQVNDTTSKQKNDEGDRDSRSSTKCAQTVTFLPLTQWCPILYKYLFSSCSNLKCHALGQYIFFYFVLFCDHTLLFIHLQFYVCCASPIAYCKQSKCLVISISRINNCYFTFFDPFQCSSPVLSLWIIAHLEERDDAWCHLSHMYWVLWRRKASDQWCGWYRALICKCNFRLPKM